MIARSCTTEPATFCDLGDYETIDAALRITNQSLPLPTGSGAVSVGGDYRLNRLAGYTMNALR